MCDFFFNPYFHVGPMHSQLESLSDSWTRLKHTRDWFYNSSYSFESDFDLTKSLGVHTLIENVVSFVSGDVGNAPGFKEPEESMSTSPQASIIAMEQQQLRAEVSCGYLLFISNSGNQK
jgi:E3 ubiquitin-protein ligase HERC1